MEATTNDRGRSDLSLEDVLARVQTEESRKVDVVLNTRDHLEMVIQETEKKAEEEAAFERVALRLVTPQIPDVDGAELAIQDSAHRQIADKTKIGWNFYQRLRDHHPDMLAYNVNQLHRREPINRMVRMFSPNGEEGRVRAWLSDRFKVLDNQPFLQAAVQEAMALDSGIIPLSAHISEERLYVKLISPKIEGELRTGDVVRLGVTLTNSEVGAGRIRVDPFIWREWCTNGATMEQKWSRTHLGAQIPEGIFSARTQRKEAEAVWSAVRDWIRFAFDPKHLNEAIELFQRSLETELVAAPRIVIGNVVNDVGMSPDEADGMLERFFTDSSTNGTGAFGVINALTRFAQDAPTYERQVELETAGGRLLKNFARVNRMAPEKETMKAFGKKAA